MIVRVASVRVAPERIDEMVSHHRETLRLVHEQSRGLRHHYWLVDRRSGELRIVSFCDSQGALEAAKPTLEAVRERYGQPPLVNNPLGWGCVGPVTAACRGIGAASLLFDGVLRAYFEAPNAADKVGGAQRDGVRTLVS